MTVRLHSTKPLSIEQRERTRSIILAAMFTAGAVIAIMSWDRADAAEACKPPVDAKCTTGDALSGGSKCLKVVGAKKMPSVNGGQYLMFEIAQWSKSKCAYSDRTKMIDEYSMGHALGPQFLAGYVTPATSSEAKQ